MMSEQTFWHDYIATSSSEKRLAILQEAKKSGIFMPLELASDLMLLQISRDEKQFLLECVDYRRDNLAYEAFLLDDIALWEQNIAVTALNLWAKNTENILWHRVLLLLCSPFSSQRVKYTILNLCHYVDGVLVLKALEAQEQAVRDFSPAFHALLFEKIMAYQYSSPIFERLATSLVQAAQAQTLPENKALLPALMSLATLRPDMLDEILANKSAWLYWDTVVDLLHRQFSKRTGSTKRKKDQAKSARPIKNNLPEYFLRFSISAAELRQVLPTPGSDDTSWDLDTVFTCSCGFSHSSIADFFAEPGAKPFSLKNWHLLSFLPQSQKSSLLDILDISQRERAEIEVRHLRGSLRTMMWRKFGELRPELAQHWQGIFKEQEIIIDFFSTEDSLINLAELQTAFKYQTDPVAFLLLAEEHPEKDRNLFFAEAFRRLPYQNSQNEKKTYWNLLRKNWHNQELQEFEELVKVARSQPHLWQIPYVQTLGRFPRNGHAVLKILDFVRSDSVEMQSIVVQALSANGSSRALQELAHLLTRRGSPVSLRLEVAHALKNHDLGQIQDELNAALNDLMNSQSEVAKNVGADDEYHDLIELTESLIAPKYLADKEESSISKVQTEKIELDNNQQLDAMRIDRELAKKLPHYKELSSEVHRALRTAQFFHERVCLSSEMSAIDLSPLVDMQYKALELLFRELFEEPLKQMLGLGIIQRKLDALGYARPIPRAMDEFEGFISQLAVIKTIPFFSKFKLRKLLRGLCQFTPDKRFTFDGLKAFGLFFICFGRSDCPFGLGGVISLGLKDNEVQEFTKNLHVVQDIRNRAAHEGFHPEAKANIDKIWFYTAEIIQVAFRVRAQLNFSAVSGSSRKGVHGDQKKSHERIVKAS